MTGHVTLQCEIYIFIFDNVWACSVSVVKLRQNSGKGD